MCYFNRQQVQ